MQFVSIILNIHIICGGLSLILGTAILVKTKGSLTHRLVGKIYYYLMLLSALASLPISYLHESHFLFVIGVFTSYMLISGKRSLKFGTTGRATTIDWLTSSTMVIACIFFIGFGTALIVNGSNFGFVSLTFGLFGLLFVKQDIANYAGKSKVKNYGTITHLQRMIGSYIASLTAFVVVNNNLFPPLLAWLLPSIALVPLIIVWSRKYKIKTNA